MSLVKPTNIEVSRRLERLSERRERMSRIHGVRVIRVGHDPCARDRFRSDGGRESEREPEDPGVQHRERAADRGEGRRHLRESEPRLARRLRGRVPPLDQRGCSRSAAGRSDRVPGVGGDPRAHARADNRQHGPAPDGVQGRHSKAGEPGDRQDPERVRGRSPGGNRYLPVLPVGGTQAVRSDSQLGAA